MKEVVILSGKGGTGKTSITCALASLANNIVIADCDVDAADLHIIANPRVREVHSFYSGHKAEIRAGDCNGCGRCESLCRFDAIHRSAEGVYTVQASACEGCKVCVVFCPQKAIDFPESHCGDWSISDTRFGPMVHAQLAIGAENSGKLTSMVRYKAKDLAIQEKRDLVLIDGPPGTGCPVMASMTACDAVVIVTEPTMAGIHDLERLLALTEHFQITTGVIVNKWTINPELAKNSEIIAQQRGRFLGRIPYDRAFSEAQRQKLSIIEVLPDGPLALGIQEIWLNIQKFIGGLG